NSSVGAEFNFTLEQTPDALFIREHENEIGCFSSELESKTTTAHLHKRWGAPTPVVHTARYEPLAIFPTDDERAFNKVRENGNRFRVIHQLVWNSSLTD